MKKLICTEKKTTKIILIVIISTLVACSTSKKSTTAAATQTPPATGNASNQSSSQGPYLFMQPPTDIKPPGTEELTALQIQFKEATLEKLKEGHVIYTETACVKCHVAQGIYKYEVVQWKSIIDDMALRAEISDAEKDAVYKYVLAIKATQPK